MKGTEEFKRTIQDYLEERAGQDELFFLSYSKPNKNIDDCVNFILETVRKSQCNGFTDEEIFGLAMHYYDEDNIQVGKPANCSVIVNHQVELTEEERKKIKEKAINRAEIEAYAALKKRRERQKNDTGNTQQLSLF